MEGDHLQHFENAAEDESGQNEDKPAQVVEQDGTDAKDQDQVESALTDNPSSSEASATDVVPENAPDGGGKGAEGDAFVRFEGPRESSC